MNDESSEKAGNESKESSKTEEQVQTESNA